MANLNTTIGKLFSWYVGESPVNKEIFNVASFGDIHCQNEDDEGLELFKLFESVKNQTINVTINSYQDGTHEIEFPIAGKIFSIQASVDGAVTCEDVKKSILTKYKEYEWKW